MQKRVMIVDDDQGLLEMVGLMLQRGGFEVVDVTSGIGALEILNESTPDLFILDVMMPNMSGIELCEELRARPHTARLPIMMLSAYGDQDTVESAMEAGANDYVFKPVRHKALLEKVNHLLGSEPPVV